MLLPTYTLAWRPFLDPIPVDHYWLALLPPLVLIISVVYKAIKLDDLTLLPRQVVVLFSQILFYMILAAAALWLLTELA